MPSLNVKSQCISAPNQHTDMIWSFSFYFSSSSHRKYFCAVEALVGLLPKLEMDEISFDTTKNISVEEVSSGNRIKREYMLLK